MTYRYTGMGQGLPKVPDTIGADVSADKMPSGLSKISPSARGRLGQIGAAASAPTSGNPFIIVPPECALMKQPVAAPNPVPAGMSVAVAVPLVAISDAQAAQALELLYGGGKGGQSLIEEVAKYKLSGAIQAVPTLVTSGWMKDPSGGAASGTLWVGLQFSAAVPLNTVTRLVTSIVKSAYGKVGAPTVFVPGFPVAVSGDSDQAFQAAATASAVSLVVTVEALASLVGGRAAITRDAKAMTSGFEALANSVVKAAQNVAAVPGALAQVDSIVSAALRAPSDQAQQTVQQLAQLRSQLTTARSEIVTGVSNIPALQTEVAAKDDPNGSFAKKIRDEVLADVQSEIAKINIGVAREYRRCMYFSVAQRSLDGFLRSVAAAFERGEAAASALSNNSDAINQALAGIDAAVAKLQKAEQQVPLSWFMREFHGMPRWAWMAGGTFIFVGGAVAVRLVKKRRQKRKLAAAPSPEMVANRRRHKRVR